MNTIFIYYHACRPDLLFHAKCSGSAGYSVSRPSAPHSLTC